MMLLLIQHNKPTPFQLFILHANPSNLQSDLLRIFLLLLYFYSSLRVIVAAFENAESFDIEGFGFEISLEPSSCSFWLQCPAVAVRTQGM